MYVWHLRYWSTSPLIPSNFDCSWSEQRPGLSSKQWSSSAHVRLHRSNVHLIGRVHLFLSSHARHETPAAKLADGTQLWFRVQRLSMFLIRVQCLLRQTPEKPLCSAALSFTTTTTTNHHHLPSPVFICGQWDDQPTSPHPPSLSDVLSPSPHKNTFSLDLLGNCKNG